jgi:hypothetical protein
MRQTTAALRRELEAAEAADERLAQAHEKETGFLDRLERSLAEREADLRKFIADTFGAVAGEIAVLRDAKMKIVAELRGQNLLLANPPRMPPVTGPGPGEPPDEPC